jgi:hypothetical protein
MPSQPKIKPSVSRKTTYPYLSKKQVSELTDSILRKLGDYLEEGYVPAVAKRNPDGSIDLIVMDIEKVRFTGVLKSFAGDSTTNAPPPKGKKKKKGKGK